MFSVCAPKLWNSLPVEVRICTSVHIFKNKMKIFLIKQRLSFCELRQFFVHIFSTLVFVMTFSHFCKVPQKFWILRHK